MDMNSNLNDGSNAVPPKTEADILVQLFQALWRRRVIAVAVAFVAVLLPAYMVLTFESQYEAYSQVHVARMPGIEMSGARQQAGNDMTDPVMIRTEVEILSSDALFRRVIEELDLANVPEFSERSGSGIGSFISGVRDSITGSVSQASASQADREANRLLVEYRRRFSIENDGRSAIATMSFTASDAVLARDVINAHARAYLKSRAERRLEPYEISDARIISPATTPSVPSNRTRTLIMIAGTVGAIGVGIIAAIAADFFLPRQRTLSEQAQRLGLRPLVSVPLHSGERSPAKGSAAGGLFRERIRALASLLSEPEPKKGLLIAVSSILPDQGKSAVSVALAQAFGARGFSTCIIDTDMRRPGVAQLIGARSKAGIADWLRGTASLSQVTQDAGGVALIAAQPEKTPALDLLAGGRLHDLLEHVRANFNVAIIETAPLLPAYDALALCAVVDEVVLVASATTDDIHISRKAIDQLLSMQANIAGLVMTGRDPDDDRLLGSRSIRRYLARSSTLEVRDISAPANAAQASSATAPEHVAAQ